MATFDEFCEAMERADRLSVKHFGWARGRCPAHEDAKPSLSISKGRGDRLLLHCHAGCTFEEIMHALLPARAEVDVFTDTCVLKGIDPELATKLGWFRGKYGWLGMRYTSESVRYRVSAKGPQGPWESDCPVPAVYSPGPNVRRRTVVVVEGETDTLSAIQAGVDHVGCVVGIPGASNAERAARWIAKQLEPELVTYVREPDQGGEQVEAALRAVLPMAIRLFLPPGAKDLNDAVRGGFRFWRTT